LKRGALLLGLLLAASCVRRTADYCATDGQCESMRCNQHFMRCDPVGGTLDPDGNPHLFDAGPDGSMTDGKDAGEGDGRADARTDTTPTCSPACTSPKPACDTSNLTCVGCLGQTDCTTTPAKPVCDTVAKTCVECLKSTDCTADPSKPICDTTANTCVGCLASSDCTTATSPICDAVAKTCGPCTADAQCAAKDPTKLACDTTSGACFPCVDGKKHCPASAPICDANACRVCKKDAECAATYGADPGLCLDGSGKCATSEQTVYLQNGPSCSTTARGDGSAGTPYCFPADAAGALSPQKSILLVRGPRAVDALSITFSANPVIVAGQSGANFATVTGTPPLISTTGGDVTLRDLTVSGGPGPGISASGGILRVLRCLLTGNAGPGIQTATGTAFDIENTVVANNGGTTRAGVELGSTSTTPTVFENNTVVGNGAIGIVCGSPVAIIGSIVFGNTGLQTLSCTATDNCASACSTTDPMLDETAGKYQLTAASPSACIDVLTTAPPTDRKGTPRPQGPKSDCGADEYVAP
jgi:hypothetical protein